MNLDFAGPGTGKPCGASHIAAVKECRLDSGERKKIESALEKKGVSKADIKRMSDEQISAINKEVKKRNSKGSSKSTSSGSTATGVGTAHELSVLKELGVKLKDNEQKMLDENLGRAGKKSEVVQNLAKENAKDLRNELEGRGYKIDDVIWTAQLRGDGLAKAAGVQGLNENNNQSDILFKVTKDGKQETIGVSLKAATGDTKYPKDIPFYNGGLGTLSRRFGLNDLESEAKTLTAEARARAGIKDGTQSQQRKQVKASTALKEAADRESAKVKSYVRDTFLERMRTMDQNELRDIVSTLTGAPTGAGVGLKTLKLTGYAKGSQSTKIEDAVDGRVPRAIRESGKLTLQPAGNNAIKIIADGVPVMNLRVKYADGNLTSSIKFSGEAP